MYPRTFPRTSIPPPPSSPAKAFAHVVEKTTRDLATGDPDVDAIIALLLSDPLGWEQDMFELRHRKARVVLWTGNGREGLRIRRPRETALSLQAKKRLHQAIKVSAALSIEVDDQLFAQHLERLQEPNTTKPWRFTAFAAFLALFAFVAGRFLPF